MLTKSIKLFNYIDKKGQTVKSLAKLLNTKEKLLSSKINGDTEFEANEILLIAYLLKMDKEEMLDIFFDW